MIKTRRVALLLGISIVVSVQSFATNVSGSISANTTWTKANSPYIVTNNILVNSTATLTIEPGVTIKFDALKSMQIDGTLIAQGISTDSIRFTSNTTQAAGAWGYIYFSDASTDAVFENDINGKYLSGNILEYCKVEYAGGSNVNNNGALRMESSAPFINHCSINNNTASGIHIANSSAGSKITNCKINNNVGENGGGICLNNLTGGTSVISNNVITDNKVINTYENRASGGGIYVYQITGSAVLYILNNLISNNLSNTGGGIYTSYGANIIINNNIIMNNTSYDGNAGGAGIHNGTESKISGNIILNNKAKNNQFGGGGICNSGNSTISNNIIADNSADEGGGIYSAFEWATILNKNIIIRNTAKNYSAIYNIKNIIQNTIAYNQNTDYNNTLNRTIYLNTNPGPVVNNNNIFNNSAFYEVYDSDQQGGTNMEVSNNWWGTTDDTSIQNKIYDWFDDNTLGIVNYSPYLAKPDTAAPVSPPNAVIKTNLGGGQVKLTWNHNPESDIKGYHVYYGGFNGYSFTNKIDVGNDTTYTLTGNAITDTIAVTAYDSIYNEADELATTIVNDNMMNGNESWYTYAAVLPKPYTALDNIRPYYIIGLGDGNWTNSIAGLGVSMYPMSLISGNNYNANGDGIFTFTGYFDASRGFKLIRDIGSWSEQWGMSNGLYDHNNQNSSNITVPTNGYYTIRLNSIDNILTMTATTIVPSDYGTMGLVGGFNNWTSDIKMNSSESANNHEWYTIYKFESNDSCKFRANDAWDAKWGANEFPYGIGMQNGANILCNAGTYIMFLNDIDGGYYFFNHTGTSINELNNQLSVELYPNPTTDNFRINGLEGTATVIISDLSGRLLISKEVTKNETVSISTIPNGIYLATIKSNNIKKTEKLIIQR